MGYDVHITRAEHWVDSEEFPITLDEWIAYVEQDSEMRLDNFAEATTTEGELIRYENRGLAVWIAYSGHEVGGNMGWFDYWRGEIVVKNPDDEILIKMKQIARRLNARVVGDEGETY